jgi:tetratricopeptide (TPR) repeat protein
VHFLLRRESSIHARLEIKLEDALMNRRERRAASKNSGTAQKASTPGTPAALYEAGLNHFRTGRHLDAQLCCQQALQFDPDHADTLHLMGLLSLHAKQYDHAVEWIARAIRQDPRVEYLSSLGTTLQQQGRFEEAVKALDKAIELKPEDARPWMNLGYVLVDLQRLADALVVFQHVLKLDPHHWDAAYRCGFLLNKMERPAEALSYFDLNDRLKPNHVVILQSRAIVLKKLNRVAEALAESRRAYALEPENADSCNNIGGILQSLRRDEEALLWFDKALALRPHYLTAFSNKAASLQQFHRFDEAIAIYRHMKTIDPNYALADWNLSLLQILTGNFEAGWAGREARWDAPSLAINYPKLAQPKWLGNESIEGRTILIGADEGLGDTIQFARYVPMIAERGARIVLVVQDALHHLMSDLPGVSHCIPQSVMATKPLPAFDVHCPIMSLPLAFATRLDSIPPPISFLSRISGDRVHAWEDRLGPHHRLRVGLAWSGNSAHRNDYNRSLPLQTLSRILDVDATFVSLQKDPKVDDKAFLRERADIIDLTVDLTDFSETAALVSCLDLVITVDTSVAHLAGSMGCPTWILLPYTPDYRWLLDRDDSPWYPTVRLFRQAANREYESVLDRARTELLKLISVRKPNDQPVYQR